MYIIVRYILFSLDCTQNHWYKCEACLHSHFLAINDSSLDFMYARKLNKSLTKTSLCYQCFEQLGPGVIFVRYKLRYDKTNKVMCAMQRLISAPAKSNQSLRYWHVGCLDPLLPFQCAVNTLIRLGRCPG